MAMLSAFLKDKGLSKLSSNRLLITMANNNLLQRFSFCTLDLSQKNRDESNRSEGLSMIESNLPPEMPSPPPVDPFLLRLKKIALNNDLRQLYPPPFFPRALFDMWCKKYGKEYDSEEERELRFQIFRDYSKDRPRLDYFADTRIRELPSLRRVKYSESLKRKGAGFTIKTNEDLLKSGIIGSNSVEEWEENYQKSVDSKKLVVVFITSATFKPWDYYPPVLAKIVKKNSHIIFLELDHHEHQTICRRVFKIDTLPTFVLIKDGKEVDRVSGLRMEDLRAMIYKHDDLAV